jgi:hypothetical protein
MPFIGHAPWRAQYFAAVACPETVSIPLDDPECWQLHPDLRWVYDKMAICRSQGIRHAPHGVEPDEFPVFSKPITNLRGMGLGSRPLRGLAEYRRHERPGHLWMELLTGEHVSTDLALLDGAPSWWRHVKGEPLRGGTFDHWTIEAAPRPGLEAAIAAWARRWLPGYRGGLNLETIGGRIIEVHLRVSDQWPDLYGEGWAEALVGLYARGVWRFADAERRDGYSVVLFGPPGVRPRRPPPSVLERVLGTPGVSSLQITFHDDRPPERHAMPQGGFRLAIVNATSLAAGRDARERLRAWFEQGLA